jgi:catechol 2,3-dioxygenase-like lactoylglutathione lyase family enzyme
MMQAAKDSIDLGIICGNIQASLHFYHDLLGLTKVGVTEASTGTMHRLRFGTSDVKLIDPTHRPGSGPIGIDQQLGFRYLTFVVTNLDEVIQRLEAAHIAFTRPKTTIRPGTTIAMVQDPDGNIVECVEPGSGQPRSQDPSVVRAGTNLANTSLPSVGR